MKILVRFSEKYEGFTEIVGLCRLPLMDLCSTSEVYPLRQCSIDKADLCIQCMSETIEEMYEDKNRIQ